MSKKRYQTTTPATEEEIVDVPTEVEAEQEAESTVDPVTIKTCRGVVAGCRKLNIRAKADRNAAVVCTVNSGTEVIVNEQESTDEFYMIYIASGIEGFCVKQYISIQ